MFRNRKVDIEYRDLCAREFAADTRISESASMLVLAQSGVQFSDDAIGSMTHQLSLLADEYGLDPEDVQSAIFHNEPTLRI